MPVLGWCLVLWYAGLSCITHNTVETVPHYSRHPALCSLQPLMSCKNSLKLSLSAQDRPSQNQEVPFYHHPPFYQFKTQYVNY